MNARRLRLTIVASLCGLVCALVTGTAPAAAGAASQFGSVGVGAGQLRLPVGVGLDQETGDVYVGDFFAERVSKFDESGSFSLAWGWGVTESETHQEELQTCTTATGCQGGFGGSGAGEFADSCGAQGVAVDNDPGPSYKDVYVLDFCNHRVQKFDPSGKFLLTFGGHVNKTSGGDVCVASEAAACQEGTQGTADGEFDWAYGFNSYIAVGPGGAVYVGDAARVQVFEPSGVWRENISLAGLSSTGNVTALAVDSTGDVFVKDEGVAGVREFEPLGIEKAAQFDVGSESVEALAVDESGDLFVADSAGGFHVLKYDPAGNELASFGSKTAAGAHGIAFSDALDELYVSNTTEANVWILTAPASGPLVEPGSVSAAAGERGHASLEASVNPEGDEASYRFEYVAEALFKASGYASASSTPSVSVGSGCPTAGPACFEDQPASAELTGLLPGETYHYRIVATSSHGTDTGSDQTFTEVPPALVHGPWVTDVADTSATLEAEVNPLGASTEYRLEYGTSTSYGQVLSGNVGTGTSSVLISYHRQGLSPGTLYHYRIVTVNEVGTIEGPDRTFTTQTGGGELTLSDGRAWELVSPPDKNGATIQPVRAGDIQAAADGSAITYIANGPVGEHPEGKTSFSQILSKHEAGGWGTEDISIPYSFPKQHEAIELTDEPNPEYQTFSPDLSLAAISPHSLNGFSLSPEAPERTIYLRNDTNGTYIPLVNDNNVPPGTKYSPVASQGQGSMRFVGWTPDLSHIVLSSEFPLMHEAFDGKKGQRSLYEWSDGRLQLVNILPNGEPSHNAYLGRTESIPTVHTMSNDGRRIVWVSENGSSIYVRDMVEDRTVQVGHAGALFETMSDDGSKIVFLEGGDLYELDFDTGVQVDLTAHHGAGESNAGVQDAVLGASEDSSYIYFVAKGALAGGAVSGEDNLYLAHENDGKWTIGYVATLSTEDQKSWSAPTGNPQELGLVTSKVSPNGRFVAFMSDRSLTGYDNLDAVSGEPDEEVYLYDAVSDRLVCASCDPTGARPVGLLEVQESLVGPVVDPGFTWKGRWIAGNIPGWHEDGSRNLALHQPDYLSDSGRLFFDSSDGLVPQDTNGLEDVYEYEPVGAPGESESGCVSSSVAFSERADGCVNLVSSGTSSSESAFMDASENGNDVFFVTASKLVAADYDTNFDVYDAHVCSAEVPCVTAPVSSPPCTSGDSCKAAPSPQPEIFGPAPSATFSGTGNVVEEAKKAAVKHKTKTKPKRRAKQKKRHGKQKERKAKKAKGSSTATSKKGGKR